MSGPGKPTNSFVKAVFGSIMLAAISVGCVERTATFAFHQPIPLGLITLAVTGWQDVPLNHPPLSSLDAPPGEKAIAVFIRWEGLDDYSESDKNYFVDSFLPRRLTITDSDGYDASCRHAMPRYLYEASWPLATDNAAPREWVLICRVWVDCQGYRLKVKHPQPREANFDVAMVVLD